MVQSLERLLDLRLCFLRRFREVLLEDVVAEGDYRRVHELAAPVLEGVEAGELCVALISLVHLYVPCFDSWEERAQESWWRVSASHQVPLRRLREDVLRLVPWVECD